MPQVKKSENWDGVAAPTLPLGWKADPGFQTSNSVSRSGANSLRFFYPGNSGYIYWTGATDGFGGNAQVTADFYFGAAVYDQEWLILTRYDPVGKNGYALLASPPGALYDGVGLYRVQNGVYTPISPQGAVGQLSPGNWYTLQLVTSGSSIISRVRRIADGYWNNQLAGWVPYQVNCVQGTDSAITAAGYAALAATQYAGENMPLYSDNFLFEDLRPDTGILLKKRRRPSPVVPVKKKRKRGWQWFSPVLKPPPPPSGDWWQCTNDSFCGYTQACQPNPPDPAGVVCLVRYGVRGGPVVSFPQATGIYHVSEPAAQAPWPAGQWRVRLNVVAQAPSGWTWDSVYICRVNTACVNQSTIASASGLGIDVSAPGIYIVTLNGVSDNAADPADSFYIAYGFLPGGAGANPQVMLDQPITTPFTYFSGLDQYVPDRIKFNHSWQLRLPHNAARAVTRRKFRIVPSLLTPQPPATGPLNPALFRRRRRRVWEERRRGNNPPPRMGASRRKGGNVIGTVLSPSPPWPQALFPKARKRRPPRPVPRYRRIPRWAPLAPLFLPPRDPMVSKALVEEKLQASALAAEVNGGTTLVVETMGAQASTILGDLPNTQPLRPTAR
jgi:hypothetical protein